MLQIIFRTWNQTGLQSLSLAGHVVELNSGSPDVILKPVDPLKPVEQTLIFQAGMFKNKQMGKVIGSNLNKIRAYDDAVVGAAVNWNFGILFS